MKKLKLSIKALLLSSILFVSCTNNDIEIEETCSGENQTIQINRFLAKLSTTHPGNLPTTRNYEYSYDENNLLIQKNEYTFDYSLYKNYSYCDNNLSEISNNKKSLIYSFLYDSEKRLTSYKTTNSYLHDYTLTYNVNKITVTGLINKKTNTTIILETNSNGLVTKITRNNGYSIFGYDNNGNLIKVIDVDNNSGTPIKEFEITYDSNPNPFYGQLQSSYLERFIDYFSDSAFLGIDVFFRFDQSKFPYLKNNPTLLKFKNCSACYPNLLKRTYEYDAQNYPVKMEESHVGAPPVIYEYLYN